MDHSPQQRKLALVAELDRSRAAIKRDLLGIHYEMDIAGRAKRSIRKNTTAWLTGAAISGLLISVLPGRGNRDKRKTLRDHGSPAEQKKTTPASTSWLWPVAKTLFAVTKPLLFAAATKFATRQADRFQT